MSTPIILVAFGTMSISAQKLYHQFEIEVKSNFPGHKILWAYTAKSLVTRLKQQGDDAKTLGEVYTIIRTGGFRAAIVQSLHIAPGYQHSTIINEDHQGLKISFGNTLLETTTDISEVALELLARFKPNKPIMVVAHGNASRSYYNSELETLGTIMSSANSNLHFTCLEGTKNLDALERFKKLVHSEGWVYVCPLFLVPGNHVIFDILGKHPTSIKSYLAAKNFVCDEVLGQKHWVRNRFLNSISTAKQRLEAYET